MRACWEGAPMTCLAEMQGQALDPSGCSAAMRACWRGFPMARGPGIQGFLRDPSLFWKPFEGFPSFFEGLFKGIPSFFESPFKDFHPFFRLAMWWKTWLLAVPVSWLSYPSSNFGLCWFLEASLMSNMASSSLTAFGHRICCSNFGKNHFVYGPPSRTKESYFEGPFRDSSPVVKAF